MIKAVFVDTSAWIMLLNGSEQCHDEAAAIYCRLQNIKLVVSNYIVSETYTWLSKKKDFQTAYSFLQSIRRKAELDQLDLVYADSVLEKQAQKLLEKYAEHRISYVDAVSFSIMKNFEIQTAFAYDRHFKTAGFSILDQTDDWTLIP